MSRLRFLIVAAMLFVLAVSGVSAQTALTVSPPSGPNGTTHTISATGLSPDTTYTLEVVYQPSGAIVFRTPAVTNAEGVYQIQLNSEASDPAGVYLINLSLNGDIVQTGTLTITAPTVPTNTGADLEPNTTLNGQLETGRAGQDLLFAGTAGQIITLTLRSNDFDAFLVLFGPDGRQLRYSDNALPPTTDAQISAYTLPADGQYRVYVTSRNAAESNGTQTVSGSFSLTFSVARAANDGLIASGEWVVGELSIVQQNAQYSFEGRAGDLVTIDLRSEAFDPAVGLFTSEGQRLITDDDGGGGLNARISRFALPRDGTYVIFVDGFRGFTGERTLLGQFVVSLLIESSSGDAPTAQATAQSTPAPQVSTGGTLDYGQTVIGELTSDTQLGRFTFVGTAGDVITIQVDSDNFDPKFTLFGPDGTPLTDDDDSGAGLNALITDFTLPRDGQYTIEVDGFRGPAGDRQLSGQYSVLVNRTSQAQQAAPTTVPATAAAPTATPAPSSDTSSRRSITAGTPVTGELTEQTQTIIYSFSGSAGDIVTIDLNSSDFDPLVRLFGPDGSILIEDDDSGGGIQARISGFVLPASGTYEIQADSFRGIDSNRAALGVFTLLLTLTPAPVQPTETPIPPSATPVPTTEPTAEPTTQRTPENAQPAGTPPATAVPQASATPVTANPTQPITPNDLANLRLLGYGDTATVIFDGVPGASERFRFAGRAGDLISLKVTSAGDVDTAVRIFGPDGALIAEDDDSGAGLDPELYAVNLPQDGDYIITLYTLSPAAQSSVTITLTGVGGSSLERGPVSVTLSDKLAPQSLTFTADAGQTIRLTVVSVSQIGGDPVIQVQQNGQLLASNTVGQNLRMSFEFVVPASGRVDVKIIRDIGAYGVIELGIERLP
jgi:hypothetical protein